MLHKASVSFISRRQKTAKTSCGRTVPAHLIAIDTDADCPQCRKNANDELAGMKLIMEHATSDTTELKAAIEKYEPMRYRTVYFL